MQYKVGLEQEKNLLTLPLRGRGRHKRASDITWRRIIDVLLYSIVCATLSLLKKAWLSTPRSNFEARGVKSNFAKMPKSRRNRTCESHNACPFMCMTSPSLPPSLPPLSLCMCIYMHIQTPYQEEGEGSEMWAPSRSEYNTNLHNYCNPHYCLNTIECIAYTRLLSPPCGDIPRMDCTKLAECSAAELSHNYVVRKRPHFAE